MIKARMTGQRQRIVAGMGANASGQVLAALVQLVSLPLFLHYWSMPDYGRWLLLSAIPGYFSLADIGLGAVAMNRMTMLSAAGQHRKSNEIFQTTVLMTLLAWAVALLVAVPIVWFSASGAGAGPDRLTLLLLIMLTLLNIGSTLFDAVFRASGQFASGVHLLNLGRLLEWLGGMAGLLLGRSMPAVAAGMLLARSAFSVLMVQYCSQRFPRFTWSTAAASRSELAALIVPGVSFLAFPLGNALSFQGMTILVGSMFGPVSLAVFNTYRTVSRLLVQMLAVFSRSLWPEVSRHFGSQEITALRRLYARGTRIAAYVCGIACVLLYFLGRPLVELWTGGKVPYLDGLFAMFLATAFASCLWQVGMVMLQATNNHRRLAAMFVVGSALMLLLAAALPRSLGLGGPVAALGLFELAMIGVSHRLVADLLSSPAPCLASI
jgi:O-antigen/teichoic acid export membrane protein